MAFGVQAGGGLGTPLVAAIVGIDGCGKSTAFRDAVARLATHGRVAGIGEVVVSGAPQVPVAERTDIPLSRSARAVGLAAKGLRRPTLYKDLKILEFIERSHVRRHLLAHDEPEAVVTDGDPLVNVAAWAVARYGRAELRDDDQRLLDTLQYLAGERRIPLRELPWYVRHGWQLAALNRLHVARFAFPDVVFLLEIDPAVAMERIRGRGAPLQAHENVAFLAELGDAYARVCGLLETRCGVRVVRIPVDRVTHEEVVRRIADAVLAERHERATVAGPFSAEAIEVIATTMSGSFEDQRKVRGIEAAFREFTSRPIRVHAATTHDEARRIAADIVAGGGRTLVSAGGAGTFNAVLEGCHVAGEVPADLRLAFLRKGSADLIGKVLHVPDDLDAAAAAISEGIEAGRRVDADVLAVEAIEPDGSVTTRHLVGFGGLGVFGDVPRFTETRIIKYYKGLLGSLLGDLGPFFVGLLLASLRWLALRLVGRVPPVVVTLDGETLPPSRLVAVIVLNGDLGKDFPLGRGLPLGSGSFRVVAIRYRGLRMMLRQIAACRTAALLDAPAAFGAIVREVRTMQAQPVGTSRPYMVNVDGLRLITRGAVRVSVSGLVHLVSARAGPPPAPPGIDAPQGGAEPWTRSSTS